MTKWMVEMSDRTYTIEPRPTELGGGWNVKFIEDGEEAGGGAFPILSYMDEAEEIAKETGESPEEIATRLAYDDAIYTAEGFTGID